MEKAQFLKDQYEESRKANMSEWSSFAVDLKKQIADHQAEVTDYVLQHDAVIESQASIQAKQKLYDAKHDDF